MRAVFGKVILEIAEKDEKVVVLTGDYNSRLRDFMEKFPDRFFNLGICEQSIMGIAAGMALEGLKPYVYSITPFLTERALEQIKLDVLMQGLNVKIVGYADYPTYGPTHAALDVEALAKTLNQFAIEHSRNMPKKAFLECYCPSNSTEAEEFLWKSYYSDNPAIINLKKDEKTK